MNETESAEDIFSAGVKSKRGATFSPFSVDASVISGCLSDDCDLSTPFFDLSSDTGDLSDLVDLGPGSTDFGAVIVGGIDCRLSPIANSSSHSTSTATPTDFTPAEFGITSNSSLLSESATPSVDLSFVTANSPASSVYASAEEDSPCAPTPPTCIRAAAGRQLFSTSFQDTSPTLRRACPMDRRQSGSAGDPGGQSFDPYSRQSFDPSDIVDVHAASLQDFSSTAAAFDQNDDTLPTALNRTGVAPAGSNHSQMPLDASMAVGAAATCERLDNVAEVTSMEASAILSPTLNRTSNDTITWSSVGGTRGQSFRPMFKVPASKSKCAVASVSPIVGKPYATAGNTGTESEFNHGAEEFSHALDALESNSKGQLAPSLARNSLYVNFDPILGRPSILPVVKQIRANNNNNKDETLSSCEDGGSVERIKQLRKDLISFSPSSNHSLCDQEQQQPQSTQLLPDGFTSSPVPGGAVGVNEGSSGDGLVGGASDSCSTNHLQQQQQHQLQTAVKSTETCRLETDISFSQQLDRRNSEHGQLKETVNKLQQQLHTVESSLQKSKLLNEASSSSLLYFNAQMQLLADKMESETRALRGERDEARSELTTLETMFSDLHRKYDRSKQMLSEKSMQCEQYTEQLREVTEQMSREIQRYDMLQQYAETTIAQTRSDIDSERKSHQTELLGLSARLKLAAHKETKLEQENQELTALCDELIQKMGVQR